MVFGSLTVLATALVLVSVIFFDYESAGAVTVGTALLWLLELILLIKGRHAFHVAMRRKIRGGPLSGNDPRAAARELLKRHGGGTMSWMTTWDGNSYYFGESGESVVAFQRHVGVVVVLADPIASPDRLAAAVDEFTTMSEANGLTPCLFSVGKETADAAARRGWRTVQVAEETIVDLPELQFTGKSWQDIRSALNKAKKDDITFRMTTLADEPFSVLAQVRAISEEWVGDKGLPEMGFTLGSVEEALDRDVRVGLAVDPTGSIHASPRGCRCTAKAAWFRVGHSTSCVDVLTGSVRWSSSSSHRRPSSSKNKVPNSSHCPEHRSPAATTAPTPHRWTAYWTCSVPRWNRSTASGLFTRSRRSSSEVRTRFSVFPRRGRPASDRNRTDACLPARRNGSSADQARHQQELTPCGPGSSTRSSTPAGSRCSSSYSPLS